MAVNCLVSRIVITETCRTGHEAWNSGRMMGQVTTDTNISYNRAIVVPPVVIAFLLSLIAGGLFSYDLIIFGTFVLGGSVIVFGLLRPKLLLYFILFSSSMLGYYKLARYTTFFEGTSFQMNLQGLRNILIITVSAPMIIFNIKKVVEAKFFLPILLYVLVFILTRSEEHTSELQSH